MTGQAGVVAGQVLETLVLPAHQQLAQAVIFFRIPVFAQVGDQAAFKPGWQVEEYGVLHHFLHR